MDLKSMIAPSKTTWVEYPGLHGFEVELAYLTKDELMKIRKKCLTNKISRKTRQMEEEVNSELFQQLYVDAVIKDWKGLKLKYLNELVPTNFGSEDPDEEVDFTQENAEVLMDNCIPFNDFVGEILEDVQNFNSPA